MDYQTITIIRAIAQKDIADGLRNKTTLAMILGVALVVLSIQALPMLSALNATPQIAIYDAGRSSVSATLRQSDAARIYRVRTPAELTDFVQHGNENSLGLLLPADFDAQVAADDLITLDGFRPHWARSNPAVVNAAVALLTEATGAPVAVIAHPVYLDMDSGGRPSLIAIGLVMALVTVCGVLVPLLFIEEKEAHTLAALFVSPVTPAQLIAGKSLAGLVYGLGVALVVLGLNWVVVVHWGVALWIVFVGALFAIAVGLLLGVWFDDPANMNLWLGVVFIAAMVPVIAGRELLGNGPPWLAALLPWLPTVALEQGVRLAFVEVVDTDVLLRQTAVLLLWALVVYLLTAVKLHGQERP